MLLVRELVKTMDVYRFKRRLIINLFHFFSKIFGVAAPPAPTIAAIIPKSGKVLAIKLVYKDGYALPGGKLDKDESLEQGIKREIREETGLETTLLEYFNSYTASDEYPQVNVTFIAKVKGKCHSSSEGVPEWVDPRKVISRLVYSDNVKALKDFLKHQG